MNEDQINAETLAVIEEDRLAERVAALAEGIATLRTANDCAEAELVALHARLDRLETAQASRHAATLADLQAQADHFAALRHAAEAETAAIRLTLAFRTADGVA